MLLHREQEPKWAGAQDIGDQPFADPDARVEYERDKAGGEHLGTEQARQTHVTEGAGEHRAGQDRELPPQKPREHTRPSRPCLTSSVGHEVLGAERKRQEEDAEHHLNQEHPLLQHRHDGAHLASSVDEEEHRECIDRRSERGRGEPSHDQHGRKKDEQSHGIDQGPGRVGVDPDRGHQGQHERRRHRLLQHLRRRVLIRRLLGSVSRAAARQAREYQDDDEERDLERHTRELPCEISPRQLDVVPEEPGESPAQVARDQRWPGIPDRAAVSDEERPHQLIAGLPDLGEDVITPGDLLDHAVLKVEDTRPLALHAHASRDDGGQGRVDPVEHRRRHIGRRHLRLRGRPGRAQLVQLAQVSLELRRPAREGVVPPGKLRAHDHPGVAQVVEDTRRG